MSIAATREGTHHQLEAGTFFALVGSQRCGTNFFRELMNTNPRTVVHGEVLLPYPLPNCWHNYLRTMVSQALPPVYADNCVDLVDDYLVYLREDTKRGYPRKLGGPSAIGFDIKYNQLGFISPLLRDLRQKPFLIDYFWRRKLPVVHIVRRNTVHQALSLAIAAARNVYHNYAGAKFEGRVTLDPAAVIDKARWIVAEADEFRRLAGGLNCLEVTYEGIVDDCKTADVFGRLNPGGKVLPKVAAFLGVPNVFDVPSTISKVVDRPYAEVIENHTEVVAAISRSEFKTLSATI